MSTLMILGANGMLGYTLLRHLSANPMHQVHGTLRSPLPSLPGAPSALLHGGVEATDVDGIHQVLNKVRPMY